MKDMMTWRYIVGFLMVIVPFAAIKLILHFRKKAIIKFEEHCRRTILNREPYPYTILYEISEKDYHDFYLKKYENSKPGYYQMLYDTKKLNISNWFSLEQQKDIFGLEPQIQKLVREANSKLEKEKL